MLVDEELGQPLVKSLVEGEFYYPKDEMLSRSRKVNYVAHNRKMTKEYSKLVASTRPSTALGSSKGGTRNNSPYLGMTFARPARARVVKDIVTPRTASDLHELWGRTLDDKFTASTLAWLAKASQAEKTHFKNAIASHPTQPTRGPPLGGRSATPSHATRRPPRPQSAPLSRPGTGESKLGRQLEMSRNLSKDEDRVEYQPMNAHKAGFLDKNAIANAVAFARSRPPSRGGISHGSRPSSAAYERPLSAMKKDRLRVPTGGAAMIAGRKIEDVHPTIQQSTFGASWAAPAL